MKKLIFAMIVLLWTADSLELYSQHSCDGSLWKYVYHPNRFTVWKQCSTVTGVILYKVKEADGDYHIRLKLDTGQPRFLNQKNMDKQSGCLVLEVICKASITQTDAVQPCKGCPNYINIPATGSHVKVNLNH